MDTPSSASAEEKTREIDWPLISFFALAYLIAWALVPVLGKIARDAGLTLNTLIEAIENGRWADVSDQLTLPTWLVFGLTRVQDFAFSIAGVVVAVVFYGRNGLRDLGSKFRPGRANVRWYLVALLLPIALYAAGAIIAMLTDPSVADTLDLSGQTLLAVLIGPGAGILFYLFLRAGLGEEPGLRGFALSKSQVRYGTIRASLIIGMLWAGWHLPALLNQEAITIVFFSIYTIALSLLFTWLFNRANSAIWVVALLHATINAGDAAFEVVLPGLEGTDWQLPALLGFVVVSIGAGIALRRKN